MTVALELVGSGGEAVIRGTDSWRKAAGWQDGGPDQARTVPTLHSACGCRGLALGCRGWWYEPSGHRALGNKVAVFCTEGAPYLKRSFVWS